MNRELVKKRFRREGIVVSRWAKQQGFNVLTVYEVLNGVKKGNYGEPHRIAVALGLKSEVSDECEANKL